VVEHLRAFLPQAWEVGRRLRFGSRPATTVGNEVDSSGRGRLTINKQQMSEPRCGRPIAVSAYKARMINFTLRGGRCLCAVTKRANLLIGMGPHGKITICGDRDSDAEPAVPQIPILVPIGGLGGDRLASVEEI
jgi:hypothetical protein